jgi:hypothetical protein
MSIAVDEDKIEAGVATYEGVQRPLEEAKREAANQIGQNSVRGYEELESALREAYGLIDKAIKRIDQGLAVHGKKYDTD